MKRILFIFLLLIFGFGSAQYFPIDSTNANPYEHILNFHSDIEISKDAVVTVTEKIKVYAGGINIKRGIFRTLPLFRNINNKKVRIKYDIVSVQKEGAKENYHTESSGDDYTIYFGSKKKILEPGYYEYELKYTTDNQIGFFKHYDEFYWNVNGALWDYKADAVSAKITLPEGAEITQNSCYSGEYGSTTSNCMGEKISQNSIQFSAKNLQDHEGLTIAVGFKKGIFTPPPPPGFLEKFRKTAFNFQLQI